MNPTVKTINGLLKILRKNKMFLEMEEAKGNPGAFAGIVKKCRVKEDIKIFPKKLFREYAPRRIIIGNHRMHLLEHADSKRKLVMYFHGGAYVKGPLVMQLKALSEIMSIVKLDLAILDYPKTPEYECKDAIAFCEMAYDEILKKYKGEEIIFLGDSAGGGLALSFCMRLRDSGKPLPDKMILLSPWLDVSMSHEDVSDYIEKDLILTVDGLIECGRYYAGELDMKDWRVSPMYGDVSDLPETHIFAGGSELFCPDCRDYAKKSDSILHFYEDMQHVWPIIPMIREAKQARTEIINLLI